MNITTEQGRGLMVMSGGEPLITQFWVRMTIPRGSFFQNPNIGHRFYLVKKCNAAGAALLKELVMETLRPLVDKLWLTSLECTTEISDVNTNRIDIHLAGLQADNRTITFDTYYQVV